MSIVIPDPKPDPPAKSTVIGIPFLESGVKGLIEKLKGEGSCKSGFDVEDTVEDLTGRLDEAHKKIVTLANSILVITQAMANMKPIERVHFSNEADFECSAMLEDLVSNCVDEGQTAIFDGSVFLFPGMKAVLIRNDINGPVLVASVSLDASATAGEQVPIIYSETVASYAKFTLQL